MRKKVVIMGASGDGLVVAQAIRDIERHDNSMSLVGFLDDAMAEGTLVDELPVMGRLDSWSSLGEELLFYPALHKVKQMFSRKNIVERLAVPDRRWATVIHPTATIADDAQIGFASFIASHVTIQPGARIGAFASIRAGANLGHDASMEQFCYVGPNATLSGRARMEDGAHLGPNGVIIDGVTLGQYAVIGAGSVATRNIDAFDICLGNPARKVSSTKGDMKRTESF